MSATIFRRPVTFLVLPADLSRFRETLCRWYSEEPDVHVIVDRRRADGIAPTGVERRLGGAVGNAADFRLPRSIRRYAGRIQVHIRHVPVHRRDESIDLAPEVAAAAAGDAAARDELRLRHYDRVYEQVCHSVGRRHAPQATDAAFELAFARLPYEHNRNFGATLRHATHEVAARR